MLKNLPSPWRWPSDKPETCRSIKQQITSIVQQVGVKFCVGFIVVIYEDRKAQRTASLKSAVWVFALRKDRPICTGRL